MERNNMDMMDISISQANDPCNTYSSYHPEMSKPWCRDPNSRYLDLDRECCDSGTSTSIVGNYFGDGQYFGFDPVDFGEPTNVAIKDQSRQTVINDITEPESEADILMNRSASTLSQTHADSPLCMKSDMISLDSPQIIEVKSVNPNKKKKREPSKNPKKVNKCKRSKKINKSPKRGIIENEDEDDKTHCNGELQLSIDDSTCVISQKQSYSVPKPEFGGASENDDVESESKIENEDRDSNVDEERDEDEDENEDEGDEEQNGYEERMEVEQIPGRRKKAPSALIKKATTKNLIKNVINQVITFTSKHSNCSDEIKKEAVRKKKQISSIDDLRKFWYDKTEFSQVMRGKSQEFIAKRYIRWVFNSQILQKRYFLQMRRVLAKKSSLASGDLLKCIIDASIGK